MNKDILLKRQDSDILIRDGIVFGIGKDFSLKSDTIILDATNLLVSPGFVDIHVHFREPGYSYKETIKTGSMAAARGGYTTVCTMPNLNPTPDCLENLALEQEIIDRDAVIEVLPYAAITKNREGEKVVDFKQLKKHCFAFSDDGSGIESADVMTKVFEKAVKENVMIASHCEIGKLTKGACIHDGRYAKEHGYKGISSDSEWAFLARDLELTEQFGARYHACHISCKESVDIIAYAKNRRNNVTCETAPHYLCLCEDDLIDDGRFKMNPPLRTAEDREALIQGIIEGTIDVIATDHAPHSDEEKSKGLKDSVMGITGLETAFPVLYTYLVKTGRICLERILECMTIVPREIFNLRPVSLTQGSPADITIIDLNEKFTINSSEFLSKGHSTPFEGKEVWGRVLMTIKDGKIVYAKDSFYNQAA